MKIFFFLTVIALVCTGCASSGYSPHYIISDNADSAIEHSQKDL